MAVGSFQNVPKIFGPHFAKVNGMTNKISFIKLSVILFLLILVIWAFYSCSKSKMSVSNLEQEVESDEEGLNPRPDVIDWIDKHFADRSKKKTAMLRLAEADQYLLANPDETDKADELSAWALACAFDAFGESRDEVDGEIYYDAISTQAFNTLSRARVRVRHLGNLSGRVLSVKDIKSWENECEKPLPR